MPDTVVVLGSGGGLMEVDRPARGHAAELFDQRLATGELTIVTDPVEWVEVPGGGRKLQLVTTGDTGAAEVAQEPRRRGRPLKVQAEPETAPEADDSAEE